MQPGVPSGCGGSSVAFGVRIGTRTFTHIDPAGKDPMPNPPQHPPPDRTKLGPGGAECEATTPAAPPPSPEPSRTEQSTIAYQPDGEQGSTPLQTGETSAGT